jgi:hypothetical protein
MGWNDRLHEDPYIPSDEHYAAREEYEAWLEYLDTQLAAKSGLASQNVDPETLRTPKEALQQPGLFGRLREAIFGKTTYQDKQEEQHSRQAEDERLPF